LLDGRNGTIAKTPVEGGICAISKDQNRVLLVGDLIWVHQSMASHPPRMPYQLLSNHPQHRSIMVYNVAMQV